ncbi:hypothetical protein ACRRTK_020827 [Alexandromys fortis]
MKTDDISHVPKNCSAGGTWFVLNASLQHFIIGSLPKDLELHSLAGETWRSSCLCLASTETTALEECITRGVWTALSCGHL